MDLRVLQNMHFIFLKSVFTKHSKTRKEKIMKGKKLLIVAAAALLGVTTIAGCKKKSEPAVVDFQLSLNKAEL